MLLKASGHDEPGVSISPVRSELFSHLVVLIACFGILAGALVLELPDADSSYVRLFGITLPNICTFRAATGLPCPGCGLLRSMVSVMHGDVILSFSYHRLGLLTIVYVFLQFLYRLGFLLVPMCWARFVKFGKYLNRGIIVLGILFFLNWILTLL
ncbi:MAG: DUF2752 domain-containing protein [Candidatus Aminicenantes bacterium]|nr:MAG: DUF2752 domain-containing protein [Candidatus Aminicenantes bacterium]